MAGSKESLAEGVYIAQLFAAKGTCKCAACRALRLANDRMITSFVTPAPATTPTSVEATFTDPLQLGAEE